MAKRLIYLIAPTILAFCGLTYGADSGQKLEFSSQDGNRTVRAITSQGEYPMAASERRLPIRNPHILAQVLWVDRNHENAVAENVSITPDGSGIFVGWWLNNERFSAYASAGLQAPIWSYREVNDWQMPVAASDQKYGGVGSGLPGYVWDRESPLFINRFDLNAGFAGRGVSFSGDGSMVAVTSALGSTDAVLLVYNLDTEDTVFIVEFVPVTGQYGVDFSYDGTRVLVSNYGGLMVYSVPDGQLIGTLYNYSQNTARISGDGSRIFNGTFNGSAFLYEWDGSQYSQLWSRSTGHDWVTAVDISADGSTVACGTLDFQSGQIAGGKFMMWDASSGDVLIDYDDYGDEVGSVSLSADGEYAIAGSWGQYGGTYGDVVTCFIRETDVPIFQLLDDTDEPGSIFSVAISDSGRYAAAGGKAVHAREFGNGGMVYSIMIRDLLENDVAVASIEEPGEFVNPGESVIPTAMFINVGTAAASFTTVCSVVDVDSGEEIYNSTYDIENLGSFSTSLVYFSPDFVMPDEGRYRMEFSAEMSSDEDMSNNTLGLVLRSWHDIKATGIVSPFSEATVNWALTPIAEFRNLGSYYETADIEVDIYDSSENLVFTSTSTVYNLGPYMAEEVDFEPWMPDTEGEFRVEFNALVPDDFYPDDNMISRTFEVVPEMIYDDGSAEVSIWVNSYPYSMNRKFAQKFQPNLSAPFAVNNCRIFLGPAVYDSYLDYLGIAPDAGGYPDTNNYKAVIENPELSGPGSWSSYDLNVSFDEDGPLWIVIHWPDVSGSGPYIGGDNTGIQDHQSYWYDNSSGWNMYPFYDWMMRMTLQEQTGATYEYASGLPDRIALRQNYPNPFNPSTAIGFALPNGSNVTIEIFDVLGARVRTVADKYFEAGEHTVIWDGRTATGEEASSGVYYYRLSAGDYRVSRKMMLIR